MTIPSQGFKKCSVCGNIKILTEFYTERRKGRLQAACKSCYRESRARYVAKMREERLEWFNTTQNESKARNRKKAKDAVYDHYGRQCACCGETEPLFLSIDHINNDGADWRREHFGGRSKGSGVHLYRWIARNNFPDYFQTLCMNCQVGKRDNGGVCPHKSKV